MSNPLTVYISGQVTGLPYKQAEHNFAEAAAYLYSCNHNPVNPLKIATETDDARTAMAKLLPEMLKCDAIYMLKDWIYSEGAKVELALAKYVGMHVIFEEDQP